MLSGDTVVLVGNAKPGQRPGEFQLSLASLKAPHVSRHPNAADEEFGWASREFLRKTCIGRPVKFKVEYSNDKGRKFGALWLHNPSSDQPADNLAIVVAANGLANIIPEEASKYGVSLVSASRFAGDTCCPLPDLALRAFRQYALACHIAPFAGLRPD